MKQLLINLFTTLLSKLGMDVVSVDVVNKEIKAVNDEKEALYSLLQSLQLEKNTLEKQLDKIIDDFNWKEYYERENQRLKEQIADTHERLLSLESGDFADFLVVSVCTKEVRPHYDVTDTVIFVEKGQMKKTEIVTKQGLSWASSWKGVNEITTYSELLALDQRKTIYYD